MDEWVIRESVTLEVAHGGFATGRYLAETPLREDELARLPTLDLPGSADRERLNLFYLSDAGQAEPVEALASGSYRIDVPEDAALVVAWLLDRGHHEAALDLVVRLRPLMHRLRMTPRLEQTAAPSGVTVRLAPVGEVKAALRATTVNSNIATMFDELPWIGALERFRSPRPDTARTARRDASTPATKVAPPDMPVGNPVHRVHAARPASSAARRARSATSSARSARPIRLVYVRRSAAS